MAGRDWEFVPNHKAQIVGPAYAASRQIAEEAQGSATVFGYSPALRHSRARPNGGVKRCRTGRLVRPQGKCGMRALPPLARHMNEAPSTRNTENGRESFMEPSKFYSAGRLSSAARKAASGILLVTTTH